MTGGIIRAPVSKSDFSEGVDSGLFLLTPQKISKNICNIGRPTFFKLSTVRTRDTQPRAARTSQVHVFKLGPKKFEMNEFMK